MSENRATGKKTLALLVSLAVSLVAVVLIVVTVFLFVNSAPKGGTANKRIFIVEKGESLESIAQRLEGDGFIRSVDFLKLWSRIRRTGGRFKAGYFRISAGASTLSIHRLLVNGGQDLVKVTIPEGWTFRKIAHYLETKGVTATKDFVEACSSPALRAKYNIPGNSLEGYLFPETYFVPTSFPAEQLAEIMVQTFFANLKEIEPDYQNLDAKKLCEKVTLASIVEREYRVKEEAPLIASVFYNRLQKNVGLESCATLEYIITEIQGRAHPEYLTIEDKRINSPYNTYKWAGLPPGPIANPGRVALDAVFHPAKTDYYYFVLQDGEAGTHHFSRNLSEHNQAKYFYLKKVDSGS